MKFLGILGAFALSLSTSIAFANPLTQLADGDYSHGEYSSEVRPNISIRKSGNVVLGVMYSEPYACFRGRLENGKITNAVFVDETGLFQYRSDLDFRLDVTGNDLRVAGQSEQQELNHCTDKFRPLVNAGVNVGMTYGAARSQLQQQGWQTVKKYPAALDNWPSYFEFSHLTFPEMLCIEYHCVGTLSKGNQEMTFMAFPDAPISHYINEVCVIDPQRFSNHCRLTNPG